MPTQLQFRRGTSSQNDSFTGAAGEISVDTDIEMIRVHDGSTAGGFEIVPTGTILPYAGASAPHTGYLLCDGTAVSRTTYSKLFALVSTTFGSGDGSTTFNIPDLRDRTLLGKGTNNSTLGAQSGSAAASHKISTDTGSNTGTGTTGTGTTGTGTTGTGTTGTGTSGDTGPTTVASTTGTGTTGTANTGTGTTGTGTTGTGTTGGTTVTLSKTNRTFATSAKDSATNTGLSNVTTSSHTHSVPGLSIPGLSVPALSVPGLSIPGLTIPALTVNDHNHSVPGLSVPGLSVPGLSVPGLSVPALSIPALTATLPSAVVNFIIKT